MKIEEEKNISLLPEFDTDEGVTDLGIMATTGEALKSQALLGVYESSAYSLLQNWMSSSQRQVDDVTEPEKIKELYPDLEVQPTKAMSLSEVAVMHAHQKEKQKLRSIIQDSNPQGVLDNGLLLGAGIAGSMIDPIDAIIGLGAGSLATKALSRVVGASAVKAGKMALTADVVGNVAGNVASEALIISPALKRNLEDVDTFNNITMAIGAGVAFPLGIAGTKSVFGKVLKNADPNAMAKLVEFSRAKFEQGLSPIPTLEEMKLVLGKTVSLEEMKEVRATIRGLQEGQFSLKDVSEVNGMLKDMEEVDEIIKNIDQGKFTIDEMVEVDNTIKGLSEGKYTLEDVKQVNDIVKGLQEKGFDLKDVKEVDDIVKGLSEGKFNLNDVHEVNLMIKSMGEVDALLAGLDRKDFTLEDVQEVHRALRKQVEDDLTNGRNNLHRNDDAKFEVESEADVDIKPIDEIEAARVEADELGYREEFDKIEKDFEENMRPNVGTMLKAAAKCLFG